MLKPHAAAYSEPSAPNCTVLEVIAKYAWQISFGLSPLVRASVTRGSAGKPGGAAKRGWKPPTARAKPLTPGGAPERRARR